MSPTLDIIIVNWNTGPRLPACLASIAAAQDARFRLLRLVIVDNGTHDIPPLSEALPVSIIRNPHNRGFGAAVNQGAAGSEADYLLLLNPDAALHPDALWRAVVYMENPAHAQTGLLGVQLVDEDGAPTRSCARFPTPRHFIAQALGLAHIAPRRFPGYLLHEWDHAESRPVDHVMGACLLLRRRVFDALGGFDERFFMYLEDLDLSLRAWQAGWSSYYLADAQAYHEGGGASKQIKARRLFYALHSRILYARKHFSRRTACIHTLITLTLEPLARITQALLARTPRAIVETLQAYRLLWGALLGRG